MEGRWCTQAAAHMYKNVFARAMEKAFPFKRHRLTIIEDTDPIGYKSRAGEQAEMKANIVVDSLPKRSPDLNVLNYSSWSEINRRMRAQERSLRKSLVVRLVYGAGGKAIRP